MKTRPGEPARWARRSNSAAKHRADARDELDHRERLGEVIVGADLETDHGVELGVARGQHDHRDVALPADRAAHRQAIHARQHEIEDHQVGFGRAEDLETFFAVLRCRDLVPFASQGVADGVTEVGLVIDEKDAAHADRTGAAGSVNVNVAPRPGPGLAASITPPCASTMCLAIERPRPLPPSARERSLL